VCSVNFHNTSKNNLFLHPLGKKCFERHASDVLAK
jgi:hypothetical protein